MKKYEELNQVHWVSKKSIFHKESHTDNILPSKESRKDKENMSGFSQTFTLNVESTDPPENSWG